MMPLREVIDNMERAFAARDAFKGAAMSEPEFPAELVERCLENAKHGFRRGGGLHGATIAVLRESVSDTIGDSLLCSG